MDSLRASGGRIGYEDARLALARLRVEGADARATAVRKATRISAMALEVERVGVWMLDEPRATLRCACQYVRSRDAYEAGQELLGAAMPRYARAIHERRALVADDALTHPDTRELAEAYLKPLGIVSMLDAPILRAGGVVGVVCHEHVGPPRVWLDREIDFAGSVADMVAIIFEQSERAELEATLKVERESRLSEAKMEALERLARTVAHDIGTVLTVARLHGDVLERADDTELAQRGREIVEAVRYGSRLVRRLSAFADPRLAERGPCDVSAVVRSLGPVLGAGLPEGVTLSIDASAGDAFVDAPASEIEQLVLNLGFNAREAIEGAGRIGIAVRLAERPQASVVVEVEDSGVGMTEEVRTRMFEPYFTTKPHGTGLGLAAVYGVVRRANGEVVVRSAPGEGTTIVVTLPRHPQALAEPIAERAPDSA
jgi:signal transduction histidine kinase